MSEVALTTPSGKEYNKEKIHLGKEVLKNLIQSIDNLSAKEVSEKLEKYKETKPGIDKNSNTFEMIALYQRSLQLLGSEKVGKVDALFGGATHRELKEIQEKKLGLKGKDIDGLPGPTTTKAIIKALKEMEKPVEKPVAPRVAKAIEEVKNPRLKEIDTYLISTEGYSTEGNGKYISKDKNHIISVSESTATQSIQSNKKPTAEELRIFLEVFNHITGK